MKISTLLKGAAASALLLTAASAQAASFGFIMTAPTINELPDDDEKAAATWAEAQPGAVLVQAADLATVDPEEVPVLWFMVDRVGIGNNADNLPLTADQMAALKAYNEKGGTLYLSNHAVMAANPLGLSGEYGTPTVWGDGEGGSGNDIWSLNAQLGFDFRPEGNRPGLEGYYDRRGHEIYAGLTFDNHNGWDQQTLALIGPGQREDHNCMWDCNPVGKGDETDVITNFEKKTGSQVLATWGHVQDHCVAALVDFAPAGNRGRVVANGLAAYEWNQNDHSNEYQANIEKLTSNTLNYLKNSFVSSVGSIEAGVQGETAFYTIDGVNVAQPQHGLFIKVENGKASKVILK